MSSRYASAKLVIAVPLLVSTILALVAGAAQTISALLLGSHPEIRGVIAVLIAFVVAEGISPISGSSFITALHLQPWVVHLLSAAVAALAGLVQIIPMSHGLQVGLVDLLTILGALGFGTAAFSPTLLASGVAGGSATPSLRQPSPVGGPIP